LSSRRGKPSWQEVHCDRPQKGRTYGCSEPIRPSKKLLWKGPSHIWVPAFAGTTKKEFYLPPFHTRKGSRYRSHARDIDDGMCGEKNAAQGGGCAVAADEKLSRRMPDLQDRELRSWSNRSERVGGPSMICTTTLGFGLENIDQSLPERRAMPCDPLRVELVRRKGPT